MRARRQDRSGENWRWTQRGNGSGQNASRGPLIRCFWVLGIRRAQNESAAFPESLRGKWYTNVSCLGRTRRLNHPLTLPQADACAWPALAGDPIGRHRYLKILDAGQLLHDFLAINSPHVDTVQEVGSGGHGAALRSLRNQSQSHPGKGG